MVSVAPWRPSSSSSGLTCCTAKQQPVIDEMVMTVTVCELEHSTMSHGKSRYMSMVMFHRHVSHYQRVIHVNLVSVPGCTAGCRMQDAGCRMQGRSPSLRWRPSPRCPRSKHQHLHDAVPWVPHYHPAFPSRRSSWKDASCEGVSLDSDGEKSHSKPIMSKLKLHFQKNI